MKTSIRIAAALASTALTALACAQASDITTMVVPFQVNNTTGAPMQIDVECGLFVDRRLVSSGARTVSVPPGNSAGSQSIGMHWPPRENPARINRFACQVVQTVPGRRFIVAPEEAGPFALPHAGLRSYFSGPWPR
jgi:hypothetical protein